MKRRTFLKLAGIGSLSIAAGCTSEHDKTLYSLIQAPDDDITGKPRWYASTCRECPAGCGILVKNRDDRIIKIEGNPLHPINRGKICMRGQAALQGIYNPDRIQTPLLKVNHHFEPITFQHACSIIKARAEKAAKKQGINRVRMITEMIGDNLMALIIEALGRWWSDGPLVFEPFAYESLKAANQEIFSFSGLPSYHMEKADVLVSFGADFLETWLSPIEYSRKFKQMHAVKKKESNVTKGIFIHVGPYQSLTGANADLWVSCPPGGETFVALGLVRELLHQGKGRKLPPSIQASINRITAPYTRDVIFKETGIDPAHFQQLISHISEAKKPLILGTSTCSGGLNALQTNMGANLLNLILDPELSLLDFKQRHRIEIANHRSELVDFIRKLKKDPVDLVLLNNVNPVYALPADTGISAILDRPSLFVVSFSNFMDETSELADLIFPTQHPLESWDEYSGKTGFTSTLQPTMGQLKQAPHLGDVFLDIAFDGDRPAKDYKTYLFSRLPDNRQVLSKTRRLSLFQMGGMPISTQSSNPGWGLSRKITDVLYKVATPPKDQLIFMAIPSIRFFDGRGANRPWLCEEPDPLTKIAWHTPVIIHPETLNRQTMSEGDIIRIQSKWGRLSAPVYASEIVHPGTLAMNLGQGHTTFGRYAQDMGLNPMVVLSPDFEHVSGAPNFAQHPITVLQTGKNMALAHTDGSRFQHDRKIALSVDVGELDDKVLSDPSGLSMEDFPLTLPLPDGYDVNRDIYPVHTHSPYRWAMVVDLDKCIGCSACSVACYAENNLGIVGLENILGQREMSWLQMQRYQDPQQKEKITFFPLLCQHCDNAPCESVCPVYAPHHSPEGLNNQIYNRCIGTRFCSQNCPYKARRFNWFDWERPKPLHLQLNPDVTVRSKGVMEKCSFCVQRIKDAHTKAKNENRPIRDGEIQPACAQTCPTDAFTFGNILDKNSRVRQLVEDSRAYQAMGYLNTKPAVIYLKKVVREI